MTSKPETSTQKSHQASPLMNALLWWVMGLACVILLALGASQLPPTFRKLGLFGVAYGILLGFLLAWQTETLGVRASKSLLLFIGLLILVSQLGLFYLGFHLWIKSASAQTPEEIKTLMSAQLKTRLANSETEPENENLKAFQEALNTQAERKRAEWQASLTLPGYFKIYVVNRLQPLGDFSVPVAAGAWVTELLLGALAGMFVAGKMLQPGADPTSDSR